MEKLKINSLYPSYDWLVPNFILWDIWGVSERDYNGRKTFQLVIPQRLSFN